MRKTPTKTGGLSLKVFLVWSLLWHAAQLVLFTTVFEIAPPGDGPGVIQNQVVQIENIQHQNLPFIKPTMLDAATAVNQFQEPAFKRLSYAEPILIAKSGSPKVSKRVKPGYVARREERRLNIPLLKLIEPEVKSKVVPFSFSQVLKKRKLKYAPPLPPYPESLRRRSVSAKLTLNLMVSESGRVYSVSIKSSSGDFRADLIAKNYAKELRFEASSQTHQGDMHWEFKLEE